MRFWLPALLFTLLLGACGDSSRIPKPELAALSPKFIMEKGVDRYINYDEDGALYYYNSIIELWGDNPDAQEYVAWANYEIGFIRYTQSRYDLATQYFHKVLQINSPTKAPQVLAAKMLKKIEAKLNKNTPPPATNAAPVNIQPVN
jgi:tetratricopeptide (TPR) repeat protein